MYKVLSTFLLCCFYLISTAYASSYADRTNQAYSAYSDKNYDKAFRLYFMLARDSETKYVGILPTNQHMLATMYNLGQGTKKNTEKAMKWYKISAKNKGILSMNALGDIYYEGNDIIPINYGKAYHYYKMALIEIQLKQQSGGIKEDFRSIRLSKMGWMRLNGKGVQKDVGFAYELFEGSVKYSDDGYSYYMLGYMCEAGLNHEKTKNLDIALAYYNKAIDRGYKKAESALSTLMMTME